MTLYVWDNGGDYSDHTLAFIETEHPVDCVVTLLDAIGRKPKNGVVCIAREGQLNWFKPDRRLTLAQFLLRFDYAWGLYDLDRDVTRKLPGSFLHAVAAECEALQPKYGQYFLHEMTRELEEWET